MIEALIAQLGPEKEEERAKAVAERKAEETEFLATATPKEKGRMRGGRGGGGGALVRGGRMEEREVVAPGGRGGGRGRGRPNEFLFTATERQRGLHLARGGHGVRGNTGGEHGRTSASGPSNIARFFPTADGNRIAERGALATTPAGRAAMARAGSNEGAGGSGMAGALARVWARRQDERAAAGGQGQRGAGGQGRGGQGEAIGHHRGGGRGGGRRGGAGGHQVGSGGGGEQLAAEEGHPLPGNQNRSATIEISSDDSEVCSLWIRYMGLGQSTSVKKCSRRCRIILR